MNNKLKLWVIIPVCAIVLLLGGTYAWYVWQTSLDEETIIATDVGYAKVYFTGGAELNGNLKPVSDKSKGSVKTITVRADREFIEDITFNLYLDINSIDAGLKHESFKFELYKDGTLVKAGNFSDTYLNSALSNCETNTGKRHITLASDIVTTEESIYTLYTWIDGTMNNPLSMESQNFDFTLHASGMHAINGSSGDKDGGSEDNADLIDASDIVGNENLYYGKTINNYTLPSTNTEEITWRIFHSDGENIYLIASDYVQNAPGISGTEYIKTFSEVYANYAVNTEGKKWISNTNPAKKWLYNEATGEYEYLNSECDNMKAVAYMLDKELWNTLYKDTQGFAEYAIGGPTLKMYAKSYNAINDSDIGYQKDGYGCGYMVKLGNGTMDYRLEGLQGDLYVIENDDKTNGMWLASPSADNDYHVLIVYYDGRLDSDRLFNEGFGSSIIGFRPVVCLSSNVSLEQVGEGDNITFNLIK